MVLTTSNPRIHREIIEKVRRYRTDLPVIVRTQFMAEEKSYKSLKNVVPVSSELETSAQIFRHILEALKPGSTDMATVKLKKKFQRLSMSQKQNSAEEMIHEFVRPLLLESHYFACQKKISELSLREKCDALLVSILRSGENLIFPTPGLALEEGDVLYVFARKENFSMATKYLSIGELD